MKKVFFLLAIVLFFSACSSTPKPQHHKKVSYKLKKKNYVTKKLFKSYKKWAGTKYCYGGTDCRGIDCSALVQEIYKEAFHKKLPRTTRGQIKVGKRVSKKQLKGGDLLFFKTSYNVLHVGIYLEKGEFIHTSSKYGVTLSNIYNPYWRSKYYEARRILL
jgi:cell wall-associated NlpC family hydrolase